MRRWQRWVGGVALAGTVALVARVAFSSGAAFPGTVWTFTPRSGVIRGEDHNRLAEEIVAVQQTLGPDLMRLARDRAPCVHLLAPAPGDYHKTVWRAPQAGRITGVACDTDGVNAQVSVDLRINDATPLTPTPYTCINVMPPMAAPGTGAMAAGDRLSVEVHGVLGAAAGTSLCFVFQPGA